MSIIFRCISFLNGLLPKSRKRILLYSNLGFRDNIEVLYRYFIENGYTEKYSIVCISNDFYNLPKKKDIKYVGLYKGVCYFLFSKYFFYFAGKYPIKPSKEQMVVNLWHGVPIKKIGNLIDEFKEKDYNYFTKIVCYSEFFRPIMKQAFNAKDEQLLLSGNVRNDDLFKASLLPGDEYSILWMPTYRSSGTEINGSSTLIFQLRDEFYVLDSYLKKRNIHLYLKLHPLEEGLVSLPNNLSKISFVTDTSLSESNTPLYSFIGAMDALITDYSSVYFDYLLLDRPIGFVLDDFSAYTSNRGFILDDIMNYMPGYKIYNFDQLLDFIDSLSKGIDNYYLDRQKINNLVNHIKKDFCKDLLKKIDLNME